MFKAANPLWHVSVARTIRFLLLVLSRWTVSATSSRKSTGLRTKTTKRPRYPWKHFVCGSDGAEKSLLCLITFFFLSSQPSDDENSDNSNECVVCLSDLRDTLILPCRHLCLCNSCADTLRYQANNCPICRLRRRRCFLNQISLCINNAQ